MPEQKKLVRSKSNRVIAGVCAGLGDYFSIDPTIIRVLFVAMVVWGGSGVLLYLILWLVMPEAGQENEPVEKRMEEAGKEMKAKAESMANDMKGDGSGRNNAAVVIGIILIVVGLSSLTQSLLPWKIFRWDYFWPVLLVAFGLVIMLRRSK